MTMIETDPAVIHPRRHGRHGYAVPTFSLELYGLPEWGAPVPTLEPIDAPRPTRGSEYVAVAPIARQVRDAVNRGRLTWSAVAFSLGWIADGHADTTRVLRRLGLALYKQGKGGMPRQSVYIRRDVAAEIARAAHLDPVDIGL